MNEDKVVNSAATTLIFVRHGQTEWNAQSRWQGWLDSPLTKDGIAQAEAAREELRGMHIDAVYASDVGRALHTARIIAEPNGLEPMPVTALRERFYGGYEGLNAAEIEQQFPGSRFSRSRDTRDEWRPPGGESMKEVRDRVQQFMTEVAAAHPGKTVLSVTHSGVVRVVDSICTRKRLEDIWHRVPSNCCVLIVRVWPDGACDMVQDFHRRNV